MNLTPTPAPMAENTNNTMAEVKPAPQPKPNPEAVWNRKLENTEHDAIIRKEELRQELKQALIQVEELNNERLKLESAIRSAEERLAVSSGSRGSYTDARAQLLARAMMGEKVDIESVPAADPMASLSVEDTKTGLKALRGKHDDLRYKWRGMQAKVDNIERSYAHQHALQHGARFMRGRILMAQAWAEIAAAEQTYNAGQDLQIPVFTGGVAGFFDMVLPGMGDDKLIQDLIGPHGAGIGPVRAESLRQTGVVMTSAEKMKAELKSIASEV